MNRHVSMNLYFLLNNKDDRLNKIHVLKPCKHIVYFSVLVYAFYRRLALKEVLLETNIISGFPYLTLNILCNEVLQWNRYGCNAQIYKSCQAAIFKGLYFTNNIIYSFCLRSTVAEIMTRKSFNIATHKFDSIWNNNA